MPGRFRGLTDQQWEVIGPLIPDPFTGYVGRPPCSVQSGCEYDRVDSNYWSTMG